MKCPVVSPAFRQALKITRYLRRSLRVCFHKADFVFLGDIEGTQCTECKLPFDYPEPTSCTVRKKEESSQAYSATLSQKNRILPSSPHKNNGRDCLATVERSRCQILLRVDSAGESKRKGCVKTEGKNKVWSWWGSNPRPWAY